MAKRLEQLTDEQLRLRLNALSNVSGKTARTAYMAALNEAVRREKAKGKSWLTFGADNQGFVSLPYADLT